MPRLTRCFALYAAVALLAVRMSVVVIIAIVVATLIVLALVGVYVRRRLE